MKELLNSVTVEDDNFTLINFNWTVSTKLKYLSVTINRWVVQGYV